MAKAGPSPTETPPGKDEIARSPDFSAAGSGSLVADSDFEPTNTNRLSKAKDSVFQQDVTEISPSDYALPKNPVVSAAGSTSLAGDSDTRFTERKYSGEAEGNAATAANSGTGHTERGDSSGVQDSVSPIHGASIWPSDIENGRMSNIGTNESKDDGPNMIEQSTTNQGETASNRRMPDAESRSGDEAPDVAGQTGQ